MKITIYYLLSTTFLFTACGIQEADHASNHRYIAQTQKQLEDKGVQVLLAGLKNSDEAKLEKYRTTLKGISESIAQEWQVEPKKITIESYLKLAGLHTEYRTYSYQNGKIQSVSSVPKHVKDSFDKHFVCYSPAYWKQFNKEQSVGFSWDTLGVEMKVDVIQTK